MGPQERHVRAMSASLHLLARLDGGVKCLKTHIPGSPHLYLVHEPPRRNDQQARQYGQGKRTEDDPPSTQHNQAPYILAALQATVPSPSIPKRPTQTVPRRLGPALGVKPEADHPKSEPEPEAPKLPTSSGTT